MMLLWQPFEFGVLWVVSTPALVYALHCLFVLGALITVAATFCIDHFELFGLKQGFVKKDGKIEPPPFIVRGLYRFVRHPIMTGLLLMFWATPVMSFSHWFYAVISSAYIFYAVYKLEEKDLRAAIGEDYDAYKKSTPAILPIKFGKS